MELKPTVHKLFAVLLTGIIGWRLPVDAISKEGVPLAFNNMQKDSILPAAIGITTTDRYPKVRHLIRILSYPPVITICFPYFIFLLLV